MRQVQVLLLSPKSQQKDALAIVALKRHASQHCQQPAFLHKTLTLHLDCMSHTQTLKLIPRAQHTKSPVSCSALKVFAHSNLKKRHESSISRNTQSRLHRTGILSETISLQNPRFHPIDAQINPKTLRTHPKDPRIHPSIILHVALK